MSNRSRRLLFLALFTSFFLLGVPLALYSYGYRIDVYRHSVTGSGGIFIRSVPGDAKIEIDGGEIKNESGILNAGTFIEGLSPKKYSIRVSKEGYRPISLSAEVHPFKAASFDKLLLIPETDHLAIAGRFAGFIAENGLLATYNDIGRIKFEGLTVPGQKPLSFTSDKKSLLVESEVPGVYLLINLSKPKSSLNLTELFWNLKSSKLDLPGKTPIAAIMPHPYEANKFLISTKSALYSMDAKIMTIAMIGDGVDSLTKSGNAAAITRKGSSALYIFTLRTVYPLISTAGAKQISFSKGGQKLAILWPSNVIEIYDIREKKSLRFSIRSIAPSGKMVWHEDENHIFITGESGVYFLETDNEIFKPELIIPYPTEFGYSDGGLYFTAPDGIRQLRF